MNDLNPDRWLEAEADRYLMSLRDEDDPEMAEDEDDYADRIDRAATLAEMRWEEDTDR